MATTEQVTAAVEIARAVAFAVRDLNRPVPSGELYAQLCGHLTYGQYIAVIDALKRARVIHEENNLLTWLGPRPPEAKQ